MPSALEALSALSQGSHSYVRDAQLILSQSRAVELAEIAESLGHQLVLEAMRVNDVRFARMLVDKLDLGDAAGHADIVPQGIAEYGDGALDVLEMLVTSGRPGFGVRALDSRGIQPLSSACQYGCVRVAKMLIAHGAPVNFCARRSFGCDDCPAIVAVYDRHCECLREVLMSGANPGVVLKYPVFTRGKIRRSPNSYSLSLLSLAVGKGNPATVAYILRAMASHGAYDSRALGTALSWAAEVDRTSVEVEMLINAGASPRTRRFGGDVSEPTPFVYAALEGNERGARHMLHRLGSEVVKEDPDYSLWWNHASRQARSDPRGAYRYLRLLLRLGFSMTKRCYRSAWSIARLHDSTEIAKLLLRCGPIGEVGTLESGVLADELSVAVRLGNRACVEALVDHGALLGEMASSEAKSLAAAMWRDDMELYGKLELAGAKLNHVGGQDWSVIGQYLRDFRWYGQHTASRPIETITFDLFKRVARSGNIDALRCDHEGNKVLHLAALHGLLAHTDFLVREMNADVNVCNDFGWTPLMLAACNLGNHRIISSLLRETALDMTVSLPRVQKLSSDTCSFCAHPGTDAFLVAAIGGGREILELLAEQGANVNRCDDRGRNAIWLALHDQAFASPEYIESVVDLLMTLGVSVDAADSVTGIRCSHLSARHGLFGTVRLLCLNGMDLNSRDFDGNTTLHWTVDSISTASSSFVFEAVRELGADVNAQNMESETALHIAARLGAVQDAEALIEVGANVDALDARGRTPLTVASSVVGQGEVRRRWDYTKGQWGTERPSPLSLVHALLKAGADPSCASSRGLQALHFAAASGQAGVCRLLAVHLSRAKLSVRSESGLTPLHFACRHGHSVTAELVLDAGAKIDQRDDRGRTALYHAAAKGRMACASTLLDRGADATLRCSSQLLPLDIAKRRGHASVAAALLRHAGGHVRKEGTVNALGGASCSSSAVADAYDCGFVGGDGFWAGLGL